jgi:glycosyltransferase involved in cell wall biosynthesis
MGKRLAVSTEFVRSSLVGGAEQMAQGVVEGLASALGPNDELVVFGDPWEFGRPRVAYATPPRPMSNRFLQERATFRRYAASFDGWLFPNYHTPRAPHECIVVTVIHDLQYRQFPRYFSLQKRLWLTHALGATLARADRVVVPSNFVREDLLRVFGAGFDRKVSVIPNPICWHRMDATDPPVRRFPYVLAVAAHYAHKNLPTLLRAFRIARERRPELRLVLVGQLARNLLGVRGAHDIPRLIVELGLSDLVTVTGYVSATELGQWYGGAELFVFPSLFEGFGMPPVEALGFGLPVITTNCGSLPEVTLGAAVYMDDPMDHAAMADLISEVLDRRSVYAPSREVVTRIRETYTPTRIGRMYYSALVGE